MDSTPDRDNEFAAISDPTRRMILEELRRGPKTVNELAQQFTISRPAISQHLKSLRSCDLVTFKAVGTTRLYMINARGFDNLNRWFEQFWNGG